MPGAFLHAVASGDPLQDRVVLWTRVSGTDRPTPVSWTIARDAELGDIVASGEASAHGDRDFTVHVEPDGLTPGTTYWYAFEALGERSPVGRTRTLEADPGRLRLAMVSCAKRNAGFFNAYRNIAGREDLDFVLHLGDYIYEIGDPSPDTPAWVGIGRGYDPPHECVSLEDYRRRYAQYHLDPDVQALHRAHPMVATVDCHEFADGAWQRGSVSHDDVRDGPWEARRAAAFRARWEWLPARPPDPDDLARVWRSVRMGRLAELFLLDTRNHRDEPVLDEAMLDPSRSQLGGDQRLWLLEGLRSSQATWKLLANSSVMGTCWTDRLSPETRAAMGTAGLIARDGSDIDPDQWDGYPAERAAILRHLSEHEVRNVVVLSGDLHVSMALELRHTPEEAVGGRVRDPEPDLPEPRRQDGLAAAYPLAGSGAGDARGPSAPALGRSRQPRVRGG